MAVRRGLLHLLFVEFKLVEVFETCHPLHRLSCPT
jgi:hypothetical protein